MCYDVSYLTKKQVDYAKRYGSEEDVKSIIEKLPVTYHTNGFEHPLLPAVNSNTHQLECMQWGLIPSWITSKEEALDIQNKTINARGETLFEKPSFKKSAASKRCLIILDGFFESHHKNGKTFPYFISRIDGEPLSIGGIFDDWTDVTSGEMIRTCSIVTTTANERMSHIHNNPKVLKRGGPRMPLIFENVEQEQIWLDLDFDVEWVKKSIKPLPNGLLKDHTVHPLRGKWSKGNTKEALIERKYVELNPPTQQTLF